MFDKQHEINQAVFITDKELRNLQHSSYMYKDFPLALIFCREFKRKGKFKKFNLHELRNFFTRHSAKEIEILFSDQSYLLIRFEDRKAYVTHPSVLFFDSIDIP